MRTSLRRLRDRLEIDLWWLQRKREIRRRGWSSVGMHEDEGVASWVYTFGFDETLGHAELVICSEAKRSADALFARAYDQVRRGVLEMRDGLPWQVCGLPRCVWRQVHPSRISPQWFCLAMYRRAERGLPPRGLRAFQLVTPDLFGALPWEPEYLEGQRRYTPELWRPAREPQTAQRGMRRIPARRDPPTLH